MNDKQIEEIQKKVVSELLELLQRHSHSNAPLTPNDYELAQRSAKELIELFKDEFSQLLSERLHHYDG